MKKRATPKDEIQDRPLQIEEPAAELVLPAPARAASARLPSAQVSEPLPSRTTVNVRTAKDQLSSLLERASEGEGMIVRFRPQAEGRVAESMAELRRAMRQTDDSTALIRAERDAGF